MEPDYLSDLLLNVNLKARVFRSGELCQNANFDGADGCGHLHVLRRGQLRVINRGAATLNLREPHLIFYAKPVRHSLMIDKSAPPDVVCASVEFSGGRANPVVATLPPVVAVPLKRFSGLSATLEYFFEEGFHPSGGTKLILNRLAEILVIQLLRVAIDDGGVKGGVLAGLMDPKLSRAMAAIHHSPERPWDLSGLAALCNLSRSRFAALFKQRVGMTVGTYMTGWRMYAAQEKLRIGKPVKLIAQDVGYGSQPAFTRAFVSKFGMSPREWVRHHGT